MKTFFVNLTRTWDRWNDDNGSLLAAGVAYYAALSFFPLLLTLISGVGLALRFTSAGRSAEQELLDVVASQMSPALSDQVASALDQVREGASISGPIGLLTLVFGALIIFVQFDTAFDLIWNVEPPTRKGWGAAIRRTLFQRGTAFLMLLGMGLLLLVILVMGIVLTAATAQSSQTLPDSERLWSFVRWVLPVALNSAVFALIYRLLPKVPVSWREALRGGAFAGITWEVGRQILTHFLIGTHYSSAYGVVGSFIAVMLWVYYAVTVVFLGAEYIQCICEQCDAPAVSSTVE